MERRLAAILSADVAGYSRLMAHDDEETVRALSECRQELARIAGEHRGRIVDATGDSVLVEFPSALEAVDAAVRIQASIAERGRAVAADRRMEFRIGVHLGDVMVDGERIYGDGINVAARLQELAPPGGVCVSGTVHEQVRRRIEAGFEDLGQRRFKNIPDPVSAYRVLPDSAPPELESGAPPPLSSLSMRADVAVFVVPAVWIANVAIVFEILFMISPFALYYYSAYGPSLNLLHGSPRTAWLTSFFLPHFSETASPVLNALPVLGQALIVVGALLFVAAFAQIYGAKLRRRGPVTGGLYRLSRHPQYTALAVLGLGTLLLWPRFLVLITYLTMLMLYALLAHHEERLCLREFGAAYRAYWERTGLLLPRRPFPRGGVPWPTPLRARWAAGLVLYGVGIAAAIGAGFALRSYSLSQVSALYRDQTAVLSPAPLSEEELGRAFELARAAPGVDEQLRGVRPLVVYVVPLEWDLPDLPLVRPEGRSAGHRTPADFDRSRYKVLFAGTRTHHPGATRERIVLTAYGREPRVQVEVDTAARAITGVRSPPDTVRWGDIPTPMF